MKEMWKGVLFVVLLGIAISSFQLGVILESFAGHILCGIVCGGCSVGIWSLLRSDKKCAPKAEFTTEERTHGDYTVKKTEAKYYMDVKPTEFVIKEETDKRVRLKSDEVETDK